MNTVRMHREALGWSREALARRADVSSSFVYQLECKEETPTPGLDVSRRLAAALGVTVDVLFPVATPETAPVEGKA